MAKLGVAFFGCSGRPGHYLQGDPCPWTDRELDGLHLEVPEKIQIQFKGHTFERKDGHGGLWLAFDFWDRTGDSRYGSHSVIITELDVDGTRATGYGEKRQDGEPAIPWTARLRFIEAFPRLWDRWRNAAVGPESAEYKRLLTDPR